MPINHNRTIVIPEAKRQQNVAIINTQCANIASVVAAFQRLQIEVCISNDVHVLKAADKLILPGVGTSKAAMSHISPELANCIQNLTQPVLGICLGMQLMGRFSQEGAVDLLQIVDSDIMHFQKQQLPLPHMGWNTIRFHQHQQHPLFKDLTEDAYFYFVHSYRMPVNPYTIASCHYGEDFSAIIAHNNFLGTQFHPEKSGRNGEILLRNFICL